MIENKKEGYTNKKRFTLDLIWDILVAFYIYIYVVYYNEIINNFFYSILSKVVELIFILVAFLLILSYNKNLSERLMRWLKKELYLNR